VHAVPPLVNSTLDFRNVNENLECVRESLS